MEQVSSPTPPNCTRCSRPAQFRLVNGSSGSRVTAWCVLCARPADLKHMWFTRKLFSDAELQRMPLVDPGQRSDYQLAFGGYCKVCSGFFDELETHHLAPRARFGDDCHKWPTIQVCRGCHADWHQRMGQRI